jgi:acetyltransferase-like isoleucine patch superfamily enzyme/8-oxo-dGTP pyrophosphatase MutT (NUDIX family)
MADFNSYMQWVAAHKKIWAFERDDDPTSEVPPIALRKTHADIMAALGSVPRFLHPNALIHERAVVQGNVTIEDGAQILPDAVINGPAFIGRNSVVGNFSLLRKSCFLSRDSLVGNHCYCNEAAIGRSARIAHFANFSRSILAYNSSVSAFVITATVKADKSLLPPSPSSLTTDAKRGCSIGTNSFIAPHVLLLPGTDIGHRCFIGSFVVVSRDVPDGNYVEVSREVAMRSNSIELPRRNKLGSFIPSEDHSLSVDRRYACVLLINEEGRFILQRRDSRPGTFNPGLISAFGGRLEESETPLQCACRELDEETGLKVTEEKLRFLAETLVVRGDKSITHCTVYMLSGVENSAVVLQEGRGVELLSEEEAVNNHSLTNLCKVAIVEYCKLLS